LPSLNRVVANAPQPADVISCTARTARIATIRPRPHILSAPASVVRFRGTSSASPKPRTASPKVRYASLSKRLSLKKMVSTTN
jgi:hypothetical protein